MILPFSYHDTDFRFNYLSILLPLLPIQSYDPASGRLVLNLEGAPAVAIKFTSLQETMFAAMVQQQKMWFPETNVSIRSLQELRGAFQPMIEGNLLSLYCPSGTGPYGPCDVSVYTPAKRWQQNVQRSILLPGRRIRVGFRLQGISLHMSPQKIWTGKFRIQHRILTVLCADA